MTDAELVEFAREFREGILDGKPSRQFCFMVSAPIAPMMNCGHAQLAVYSAAFAERHCWLLAQVGIFAAVGVVAGALVIGGVGLLLFGWRGFGSWSGALCLLVGLGVWVSGVGAAWWLSQNCPWRNYQASDNRKDEAPLLGIAKGFQCDRASAIFARAKCGGGNGNRTRRGGMGSPGPANLLPP